MSGIPYVLASLTLSQAYGQDLLHASAFVTLAELWLGLGVDHAQQALSLLEHCLPMVRGHGGIHLRARANLAVARCYLSSPSFSGLARGFLDFFDVGVLQLRVFCVVVQSSTTQMQYLTLSLRLLRTSTC